LQGLESIEHQTIIVPPTLVIRQSSLELTATNEKEVDSK
jgi:hypothetical protein